MSMYQNLRATLTATMKSSDEQAVFERNLIRFLIGEVQRTAKNDDVPDDDVKKILKKAVENNRILIAELDKRSGIGESARLKAIRENEYLIKMLPGLLQAGDLNNAIATISIDICNAKSHGQAVGMANKYLKEKNIDCFGEELKELVAVIRTKGTNEQQTTG